MQLSVLRYFLAVAELGSIRQAAERLHVAASAVSRQIANLEYDYGVPLFERHAQGVRLTLAGEIFSQHARTTLREFDRVRSDIDDVRGLKRGNVRIATVEGVVSNFLFSVIEKFGKQFPNVTFEVNVAGTGAILESIARDESDLGIVFNALPHPDIETGPIIRHPLVAIMSPQHPLAGRASVSLADLAEFRLGALHPSFGTRQILDRALIDAGVRVDALLTINSIEMLKAFVVRGLGISVMPRFAVAREQDDRELVIVAIDNEALCESHLALCWRKERSLGAAADTLRAYIERELPNFFAETTGTLPDR